MVTQENQYTLAIESRRVVTQSQLEWATIGPTYHNRELGRIALRTNHKGKTHGEHFTYGRMDIFVLSTILQLR